ncbi:MAG: hypothetical protein HQ592_06505 [Planctomycetes bacterium]|nr:hypothetical protein [Planctomycetota bacterium]
MSGATVLRPPTRLTGMRMIQGVTKGWPGSAIMRRLSAVSPKNIVTSPTNASPPRGSSVVSARRYPPREVSPAYIFISMSGNRPWVSATGRHQAPMSPSATSTAPFAVRYRPAWRSAPMGISDRLSSASKSTYTHPASKALLLVWMCNGRAATAWVRIAPATITNPPRELTLLISRAHARA